MLSTYYARLIYFLSSFLHSSIPLRPSVLDWSSSIPTSTYLVTVTMLPQNEINCPFLPPRPSNLIFSTHDDLITENSRKRSRFPHQSHYTGCLYRRVHRCWTSVCADSAGGCARSSSTIITLHFPSLTGWKSGSPRSCGHCNLSKSQVPDPSDQTDPLPRFCRYQAWRGGVPIAPSPDR